MNSIRGLSRRKVIPQFTQTKRARSYSTLTTGCVSTHTHQTRHDTLNSTRQPQTIRNVFTSPSLRINHNIDAHVNASGKEVMLSFSDNLSARFHAPWLWSNDPAHIHATSGQRLRTPGDYPGTTIQSVSIVSSVKDFRSPPPKSLHPIGGIYAATKATTTTNPSTPSTAPLLLKVTWTDQTNSISYFDLQWLHERIYDQTVKHDTQVTTRHALRRIQNNIDPIQSFRYPEEDSTDVIFPILQAVVQDGAVLITNAPPISSGFNAAVRILGQALTGGTSLSHGALYGELFQVQFIPSAHNIAYTNVPLPPHIDLGYYESPPGLQLLHCISNNVTSGGESILVDLMAAANEFRKYCPHLFDILTKCPATFVKQREGVEMMYQRPHFVLQNNEIVTVNWSPPFEGPLYCTTFSLVEEYYVAYCAFQKMLDKHIPLQHGEHALTQETCRLLHDYAQEYTWEKRLDAGEILVFNNRRMGHGRNGFIIDQSNESGGRHLTGCYTNIDETLSHYRVLLRERWSQYSDVVIPNIGNGSRSTM